MTDPVILAPHDPSFAVLSDQEYARWKAVCGPALVGWHHIGSTAVPGLIAKPVLDMAPVFATLDALDDCKPSICAMGVEWWGEYGLPGRRYCKRPATDPVQHIHCYAADNPEITRHTAFRDYLRAHPDAAADYAQIKSACAEMHRNDRGAYGACKSAWIIATERKALTWVAMMKAMP